MTNSLSATLARLILTDFRNYARLDVRFDAPLIAFVGNNGVGKTNILEAISYLTAGRGLRRAGLADVARSDGSGGWSVAATLIAGDIETRIGTGFTPGETGRRVRIDGDDVRTSDALLAHLRVLWLVPSMDGLFTGPASDRRRFLDRLTLSIDPAHGRRVGDFEKALRQRNKLLEQGGGDAYLTAVENQVAELGTAVALARRETVGLLSATLATQSHNGSVFPRAGLAMQGSFEDLTQNVPAADCEDLYRQLLRAGRSRDRAAGRTLNGPHLSDLAVRHAAKDRPAAQSSTGEQKALLIGLILAHAELTGSVSGIPPVLLLDEVAAHLDPDRRSALFQRLVSLGGQVFMTGTDRGLFAALPDCSQMFAIERQAALPLNLGDAP